MEKSLTFDKAATENTNAAAPREPFRLSRDWLVFGGLTLALLISIVVGTAVGSVNFPFSQTAHILFDASVGKLFNWAKDDYPAWQETILFYVRLPRVAVGALVGGGLALSGAVMQAVFRNPLADPSVIGVSAGAALGAVLMLYAGAAVLSVSILALVTPLAAFIGALVCAFTAYFLASSRGRSSVSMLLLAGVAISSLAGAVTSFILSMSLRKYEVGKQLLTWLMGDLEGRSWEHFALAAPLVIGGCAWLCVYARDLNVLLTGEDNAAAVSIDVPRLRRKLIVLAALVTAATVAVVGAVAFVGLILPHTMRLLLGPDNRRVLPASLLGGMSFVILADTLCRTGFVQDLRLGTVTALCGAPFFLYLLIKNRSEIRV